MFTSNYFETDYFESSYFADEVMTAIPCVGGTISVPQGCLGKDSTSLKVLTELSSKLLKLQDIDPLEISSSTQSILVACKKNEIDSSGLTKLQKQLSKLKQKTPINKTCD